MIGIRGIFSTRFSYYPEPQLFVWSIGVHPVAAYAVFVAAILSAVWWLV